MAIEFNVECMEAISENRTPTKRTAGKERELEDGGGESKWHGNE